MSDYLIVGGGSAGCVLANRLSADPNVSIALIEAGSSSRGLLHRLPAAYFQLMKAGRANWNEVSVEQPGLDGRSMNVPIGRALGEFSAMVWVRGNAGDYDS